MSNELITTQDGSHSLHSSIYKVDYHSKYGAMGESEHVFINAGLRYCYEKSKDQMLRIFEMGFGTGLNALMSLLEAEKESIEIEYYTIEKHPIKLSTALALNFSTVLNSSEHHQHFKRMHECPSRTEINLSPHFRFTKIIGDLLDEELPTGISIIYYDAFAPDSQPELWSETTLNKLFSILQIGGCLVTYCAKGSFKRALKSTGFIVESIPGPHGKREMTRATKPN